MHCYTVLHCAVNLQKNWFAVNCSTTLRCTTKRVDARLSCSGDFATGKCRSIDRLAEKGFLHQKLKQTKFAKQETGFSYPLILSHLKTIRFKKQLRRGPYSVDPTPKYSHRVTRSMQFCIQIESFKLNFIPGKLQHFNTLIE